MIHIPPSEFKFTFSRSSGAGGQNVNKVNSKATLLWDINLSKSCHKNIKERFIKRYKRFIFDNIVMIKSERYREQSRNIEDCILKLHEFLSLVEFAPKARKATRPTRGSVKRRLDGKKLNSLRKKERSEKH